MKINAPLDFQGNEIKLATPEKVTALPDSNLFVGRTCILISNNVGSIYYYNGEQWCNIEGESLEIDETKINVIDDEITVHKFDTLADAKTYINSNNKPKSVIIGSNAGITSIGNNAFKDCISLKSISIPNGVTSIDNSAFENCTKLTSITIPLYGVTSIGERAFCNCGSLTSIRIPDTVTSIGEFAFDFCSSLKSIRIPSTVTSIGTYAFSSCSSLTSITIHGNVTNIDSGTFFGCTSLTSITIPSTVTSIGSVAFENCKSLTSITIPSTASIGNLAFRGCDILSLENYKSRTGYPWGASNIYIQNEDVTTTLDSNSTDRQVPTAKTVYDALSSSGSSLDQTKINVMCDGDPELYTFFINSTDTLKHVIIGSNAGITSIGDWAFSDCASLKYITIPSGVTFIGIQAFENCTSLISINIPSSVTSIGKYAFSNCTSLKSITIPDSVTSIGDYAFNGCTSLTSITIPSSITSIGEGSFKYCTSLTGISMSSSITSIGSQAFENCTSLTAISIYNVTSIGDNAFSGCKSLAFIIMPTKNATSIGNNAFNGCTSLASITIPNSASIGNNAFNGCTSLASITIPKSVSISNNAFSGCDIFLLDNYKSRTGYPWGATNILIQNEDVTTTIDENSTDRQVPTANGVYNFIMENMFSIKFDMDYLKEYIERTITSIDIPDGVTYIGNGSFYNCTSLTSITIPSSVTDIYINAFAGCASLTSITINKPEGSISGAPWNAPGHPTIQWTG